ncbi:hypothetical protein GGS24DRAFT_345339 [Hypoxylon argillaceum]|nr:hypothetical protein GGS24DRAFT_345339 [Hypoxylon argillaceum]
MASELGRPPTRTASGSRPSTSRFQEGSMNDRTSAAPPAQFLGPEQLKDYENQFSQEPPTLHEARRPRPFSASAIHRPVDVQEPQQAQQQQQQQQQQRGVIHKKSTGFFGRVRDVLFHRAAAGGHHGPASKQQEVRRKHSSLQEPIQNNHAPVPPRPEYMHAGRTQSEVNIAQMLPNPRGLSDRPSRDDVLASYNQLVASGFFQSHAIQSTRHAPPTAAAGGRQTPVMPIDNQPAPRPRMRLSSIRGPPRSGSVSPMPGAMPSPSPAGKSSREYAPPMMPAAAAPRTSLSSLFRPSIPDLHTSDSRHTLRGRKRTRGDSDETPVVSPEPQSSGSTSYFSQPLRRVAKKLREMPSATFQASNEASHKNAASATNHHHTAADGIVHLTPSVTAGGSLHPNERPIRLRSPSPAAPETTATGHNEWKSERPAQERDSSATRARRPRRTFSYNLTQSVRGRTRTIERECERERERETTARPQRRGSSAGRSDSKIRAAHHRKAQQQAQQQQNPLGVWQRVSLEDTVIHRDSIDTPRSQRRGEWDQDRGRTSATASPTPKARRTVQQSPLKTLPDANRGAGASPSRPKAPERWHGNGKAYHLKDRGSRPDLAARHSADGGKAEGNYGKENDSRRHHHHHHHSYHVVDADGDLDLFGYETRRQPRESRYRQPQHPQHPPPPPPPQHQWRIGNAL